MCLLCNLSPKRKINQTSTDLRAFYLDAVIRAENLIYTISIHSVDTSHLYAIFLSQDGFNRLWSVICMTHRQPLLTLIAIKENARVYK